MIKKNYYSFDIPTITVIHYEIRSMSHMGGVVFKGFDWPSSGLENFTPSYVLRQGRGGGGFLGKIPARLECSGSFEAVPRIGSGTFQSAFQFKLGFLVGS